MPRFNADETEYYINAGGTEQPGAELYLTAWIIRENSSEFIRGVQFNESLTLDRFTFSSNYHDATANYAGNHLTGVPEQVVVTSIQIKFPQYLYLFIEHNYTASIPLNDGNTAFAPKISFIAGKGRLAASI